VDLQNLSIFTKIHPQMAQNQALIAELKNEAASTRKMLERVPDNLLGWKPHEKSYPLGKLAAHIADLPGWVTMALQTDELDFEKRAYKSASSESTKEILDTLDAKVSEAITALEQAKDEDFGKMWTLRKGEHVYFSMPKASVIRLFSVSHLIHHRGQLSVYLRLNDVPVPGMYGPSADDTSF